MSNIEDGGKDGSDWVEVKNFTGVVYAEMAKELLENNDIPCLMQRDFMSSAYGIHGAAVAGSKTKLLVPKDRLEESRNMLTALSGE